MKNYANPGSITVSTDLAPNSRLRGKCNARKLSWKRILWLI